MARKKENKPLFIKILKATRADGKSVAVGDEFEADKDLPRCDCIILLKLGKADVIEGKTGAKKRVS